MRNAAFCCARRCKIWIPEIEYYQIVSSHAQIWPQGAQKQLSKVNVVVGGGCRGQTPTLLLLQMLAGALQELVNSNLTAFGWTGGTNEFEAPKMKWMRRKRNALVEIWGDLRSPGSNTGWLAPPEAGWRTLRGSQLPSHLAPWAAGFPSLGNYEARRVTM